MPPIDSTVLAPHPQTPAAGLRVEARAERRTDYRLRLVYTVIGEELLLPDPEPPSRADELWRTTCFEAFVAAPEGDAYLEINLSPSGRWALYAFDSYRQGMGSPPAAAPGIEATRSPGRFELAADIDLAGLAPAGPWRVALTAVIERADGAKSYWSLAHPQGKPDFHDIAGFVLSLPERT
jgi:hypothetical protein